ncbi:addiction module protein [Sphingomonas sp. SUN039]|uniref:addiction module protein n=1 Tax=Sphingomonas sp. SUN039 TaxID=2937787 RepID=UPI002164C31A|nr:addiction module protein [Sphingomonas sp. SUN039]UVO55395.1 addiction module protein [Sphingomonas sp. SUN039]
MNGLISSEIARLSPDERLDLIGEIWETLDGSDFSLTPEQDAELDRRLATVDQERAHAVPWQVVKDELTALTQK